MNKRIVAAAVSLTMLAGACGSDEGTSTSTSPQPGPSSTAIADQDTPATTATGAEPGEASPAAQPADDDSTMPGFNAAVAEYTAQPVDLGEAPPIGLPIPEGKSLIQISTGTGYDQLMAPALEEATAALGWDFGTLQTNLADPASTISALTTAINADADYVVLAGTPRVLWQNVLPDAAAAGTTIIAVFSEGDGQPTPPDGIIVHQDPVFFSQLTALWLTDAIMTDADDDAVADPNVLVVSLPVIGDGPSVLTSELRTRVGEQCSTCSVDELQIQYGDVFALKANERIVAYLQANPDTDYVVIGAGQMATGLPRAIQAAGLASVKITGSSPGPDQLRDLNNDDALAWIVPAWQAIAWMAVDTAARDAAGAPEYVWPPHVWMVTAANVDEVSDLDDPEYPVGYPALFEQLWGTGR